LYFSADRQWYFNYPYYNILNGGSEGYCANTSFESQITHYYIGLWMALFLFFLLLWIFFPLLTSWTECFFFVNPFFVCFCFLLFFFCLFSGAFPTRLTADNLGICIYTLIIALTCWVDYLELDTAWHVINRRKNGSKHIAFFTYARKFQAKTWRSSSVTLSHILSWTIYSNVTIYNYM